jgi:Glycosyltransferase
LGTDYPIDESRIHGGIESVARNLATALSVTREVDVHVVALSDDCRADALERRDRLTIHWLARRPGLGTLKHLTVHARRVARVYREISPDIVHAQGFSSYAIGAPVTCPLVLTVHGIEWFLPGDMGTTNRYAGAIGAYRRLAEGLLIRRSLAKASTVVAISVPFVPETIGAMLQGKRVRGIPNPIVLDGWLAASPGEDDGRTVLCVGMVERRKDPMTLVRAFAKVARVDPESRLIFAGEIVEREYHGSLLDEVSNAGLAGRVEFLGLVSKDRLFQICANAAVVASAAVVETAPMAIAEAMAAGRAVVAVGAGGVPAMIEDGVSGFVVPPSDVDTMADRIRRLLVDKPLRGALGSAARKQALDMFGSASIARQTLDVYDELLGRRPDIS